MKCWILHLAAAALAPLAAVSTASAVTNGTEVPCNDRRFDAVGLFITAGYDPGPCAGAISGSCVLIAPDMVIAARHSLDISPADAAWDPAIRQYRVRFRRATNGAAENHLLVNGDICHGAYQELKVVEFMDAPNHNSDQVMARLERPVAGIRPIGVELNNPPRGWTNIILAGWGYAGACYATGEHWTLRYAKGALPTQNAVNDYLVFSPCVSGTSPPCMMCPGGGPWVQANLHDSGAGVFIEVPSVDPLDPQPRLRLIGTVSSQSTARRPSAWNNAGGSPRLVQASDEPAPWSADFNCNGTVSANDVFAYLDAFFTASCTADVDRNGAVEAGDIFHFLSNFFAATTP